MCVQASKQASAIFILAWMRVALDVLRWQCFKSHFKETVGSVMGCVGLAAMVGNWGRFLYCIALGTFDLLIRDSTVSSSTKKEFGSGS